MSNRTEALLMEMADIFGVSFEEGEISERRQGQRQGHKAPGGGRVHAKGGGVAGPSRPRKQSKRAKGREVEKEKVSAKIKKRKEGEDKKYQGAMKAFFADDPANKKKLKGAATKAGKRGAAGGGGGGAAKGGSSGGGSGRHYPFKNGPNLGPTTDAVAIYAGPRHHDKVKCWKCSCPGNVYSTGCNCVSSGQGEGCPKAGTKKHIRYKKEYKRGYNDRYHAWRGSQGGAVTARVAGKKRAA